MLANISERYAVKCAPKQCFGERNKKTLDSLLTDITRKILCSPLRKYMAEKKKRKNKFVHARLRLQSSLSIILLLSSANPL